MTPSSNRLHATMRLRPLLIVTAIALFLSGLTPYSPQTDAHADLVEFYNFGVPGNPLNFDKNPLGIAYGMDPVSGERQAYVATFGSGPLGSGPSRLYAFSLDSSPIGFQNASIDLGFQTQPIRIYFNQSTNQIFVPRKNQGDVVVLTGTTGAFTPLTIDTEIWLGFSPIPPHGGATPNFAQLNNTTNKLYVPRTNGINDVVVIDGYDTGVPIDNLPKIPLGDSGAGVAIDEATNRIFVSRPALKDIAIIDGNTNTLTETIPIAASAQGLAFNPVNGKLYAAIPCKNAPGCTPPNLATYPGSNSVAVVDTTAKKELYKIRAGIGLNPYHVAVNPTTNRVYVTSQVNREIAAIDSATDGVLRIGRTIQNPQGMAVDTVNNMVLMTSQGYQAPLDPGNPGSVTLWSDPPSVPPVPKHFFPEGTTRGGFQSYITLYSPDITQTVTVTYDLGPGQGGPVVKKYQLNGGTRLTIDINADVGPDKDVATTVEATGGPPAPPPFSTVQAPFFAERVMYFNGVVIGATDGTASAGYSNFWQNQNISRDAHFFAEGTTRTGFQEYVTLLSPVGQTVDITYYFGPGQGAPKLVSGVSLPAGERVTINVNDSSQAGPGKDVSTKIVSTSSTPFYAERPMYFDASSGLVPGGHNAVGSPLDPFTDTVFAEGTTRPSFSTFLTIYSDTTQRVKATFYPTSASPEVQLPVTEAEIVLPANERVTVNLASLPQVGPGIDVSTRLTSCGAVADCTPADPTRPFTYAGAMPFYAERPVYFDGVVIGGATGGTVNWPTTTFSRWESSMQSEYYFAEGTNRLLVEDFTVTGGFQTYLTMASVDITQTVQITLAMGKDDPPAQFEIELSKYRRTTVSLSEALFGIGCGMGNCDLFSNKDFAIHVQSRTNDAFYVERPMYFGKVFGSVRGGTVSTGFHN